MGANSKQGWYLLVFIVGFTFLVAGLAYLGPLFTLVGLARRLDRSSDLPHQAARACREARGAVRSHSARPSRNAPLGHAESTIQQVKGKANESSGSVIAVLGWLIAVSSVEVSSVGLQLLVALIGLLVALGGVVGVLNGAHLKNAIWKS